MDGLKIAKTRILRGVRVMRNFAGIGLFTAALLAAAQARADVTLGPGETLTWATDAPASGEAITATGGTLVFDSEVDVPNNLYLGGEVAVTVNNDALVRFTKTFFQTDPSGRLVLPRTARFGSRDSGKFAFLPENAIASDAQLRLAGYSSMLVLPDKWSNPVPYAYGTNCLVCFYGGYMVTDAAYTVPERTTIRMTSPTNFPSTTVITVPSGSTFQDRPAKFNPATNSGDGVDNNTTTVRSNDVVLAGGTFEVATGSTHQYWGNISGTGTIYVSDTRPDKARNCYHYFYGDISGMDAGSQLTIDQVNHEDGNMNNGARLNSDFPGTVKINYTLSTWKDNKGVVRTSQDTVSFGFNNPNTSGSTNENWRVGALQGGSLIGTRNGEGGARLQYFARQHIHVGRLSGRLAIFATAANGKLNSNDLTVDTVADDTILYVKNGLRLHFGTVGKGVKIRYMPGQVSSNVVEVASGSVEEITFLGTAAQQTKPVYLYGNVGYVGGPGKVIACDGTSRVGFVGDGPSWLSIRGRLRSATRACSAPSPRCGSTPRTSPPTPRSTRRATTTTARFTRRPPCWARTSPRTSTRTTSRSSRSGTTSVPSSGSTSSGTTAGSMTTVRSIRSSIPTSSPTD